MIPASALLKISGMIKYAGSVSEMRRAGASAGPIPVAQPQGTTNSLGDK